MTDCCCIGPHNTAHLIVLLYEKLSAARDGEKQNSPVFVIVSFPPGHRMVYCPSQKLCHYSCHHTLHSSTLLNTFVFCMEMEGTRPSPTWSDVAFKSKGCWVYGHPCEGRPDLDTALRDFSLVYGKRKYSVWCGRKLMTKCRGPNGLGKVNSILDCMQWKFGIECDVLFYSFFCNH